MIYPKIGILRNEEPESGNKWSAACQKYNILHEIIDITASDWYDKIKNGNFQLFLLKPPGNFERSKKIYDERIFIISEIMKYPVFPSFHECYIYENKKLLADYLTALNLPHPKTKVFYNKKEAKYFILETKFPLVAKTTIGASGSGVNIIKDISKANRYINKAFSSKGIRRRYGPNRAIGSSSVRVKKAFLNPAFFIKKIKSYYSIYKEKEKHYVIFQEYIQHDFEWRMVKIGESYFGHKKIKYKEKASGSKGIDYSPPPVELLNFTRDLCNNLNFNFMAIDLFEDGKGGYLINELQTLFGHVQDFILQVDGKPGRFYFYKNKWTFEAGDFNRNESYDLRLKTALELFEMKNQ